VKLNRLNATPLYRQLYEQIKQRIEAGEWMPGQLIFSEMEFAEHYGVSRITVRQAVSDLVQEDLLHKVPGKGTFVSPRKVEPLNELSSFSENMVAQGCVPSYRVLRLETVIPPPGVASELRLPPGRTALLLQRLLLADGQPIGIQTAYYPSWVVDPSPVPITEELVSKSSVYHFLESHLGLTLWKAQEVVDVSAARAEEVKLLGLTRNAPVLVVRRTTLIEDQRPIERVTLVFRADKYRYRFDLYRKNRP